MSKDINLEDIIKEKETIIKDLMDKKWVLVEIKKEMKILLEATEEMRKEYSELVKEVMKLPDVPSGWINNAVGKVKWTVRFLRDSNIVELFNNIGGTFIKKVEKNTGKVLEVNERVNKIYNELLKSASNKYSELKGCPVEINIITEKSILWATALQLSSLSLPRHQENLPLKQPEVFPVNKSQVTASPKDSEKRYLTVNLIIRIYKDISPVNRYDHIFVSIYNVVDIIMDCNTVMLVFIDPTAKMVRELEVDSNYIVELKTANQGINAVNQPYHDELEYLNNSNNKKSRQKTLFNKYSAVYGEDLTG